MTLRIGSVPYLNAKPMVDWFHTSECTADVSVTYAPPSELAKFLRRGELDVANVSSFEGFQNGNLVTIPGISISSRGPVKSVRLFCRKPPEELSSVALDTSSLTSVALTRILLQERYHVTPHYSHHKADIEAMLSAYDAGLIIGDLRSFDLMPGVRAYDLGQWWNEHTGAPFVYATWQARAECVTPEIVDLLTAARNWGAANFDNLAARWAPILDLPLDQCIDYLYNVIDYRLEPDQLEGLALFQRKCHNHGLIAAVTPIRIASL